MRTPQHSHDVNLVYQQNTANDTPSEENSQDGLCLQGHAAAILMCYCQCACPINTLVYVTEALCKEPD